MNCSDVRDRLMDLIYGELVPQDDAPLCEHLSQCAACQLLLAELQQGRELLGALVEKPVRLDVRQLLQTTARRAEQSGRRWRRAAAVATAAAMLLVGVLLSSLHIEAQRQRLIVSWGAARQPSIPKSVPLAPATGVRSQDLFELRTTLEKHAQRLAAVDELVRLLVVEIDSADLRQQRALSAMRRDLYELRRQSDLRWKIVDHDVRDLGELVTQASFAFSEKGEQP